ncbi:uncharacterized protein BBOV_IV002984 [Babesia bovis T2Bo]|uniref:uncharacterized protein n=1 Tax=Babesia bovis T2Bo TaxID=484906 RepID=UPI001D99B47A|nr:uncharacterized protein BBOV_IV002984 [Babesia bovis T2Bo]KAG6439923.1 hypothetical protein BBOV_IV002984 [Babesia bovis T2Bo]
MLLIEILWATAILGQARAIGLEPLLESNRPPYTLINFALEQDTRVDQIGELQRQQAQGRRTRLATQFNRRRDWLDNQFNELKDKQMNNRAAYISP